MTAAQHPRILASSHPDILASRHPGTLAAAQSQPFNLSRKSPSGMSGFWHGRFGSTDLANTSRTTAIFTQDLLYTGNKLPA